MGIIEQAYIKMRGVGPAGLVRSLRVVSYFMVVLNVLYVYIRDVTL